LPILDLPSVAAAFELRAQSLDERVDVVRMNVCEARRPDQLLGAEAQQSFAVRRDVVNGAVDADHGHDVGLVLQQTAEPGVASIERLLNLDLRRDVGHRGEYVGLTRSLVDEHRVELHPHSCAVSPLQLDRLGPSLRRSIGLDPDDALRYGLLHLFGAHELGGIRAYQLVGVDADDLRVGRVAREQLAVETDGRDGSRSTPELGVEAALYGRTIGSGGHRPLSVPMGRHLTDLLPNLRVGPIWGRDRRGGRDVRVSRESGMETGPDRLQAGYMTNTDANKKIVTEFIDGLFSRGDLGSVDAYLSDHFVDHDPPFGTSGDREGMRAAGALIRAGFPDWHSELHLLIAEGDAVAEHFTAEGTHQGEIMGVAPTGRKMILKGINIFRIRDGRIIERWGRLDEFGLLQQLGVIPTVDA